MASSQSRCLARQFIHAIKGQKIIGMCSAHAVSGGGPIGLLVYIISTNIILKQKAKKKKKNSMK